MPFKFNPLTGKLDVVNSSSGGTGSIIYSGAGAPDISLGVEHDLYINSNTGDYYIKDSTDWVLEGTLTGPVDPIGPEFDYNVDGTLALVTYDDGSTKTFTYVDGKLDTLVYVIFGGSTHTKTFYYSGDTLIHIDEVIT